MLLLLIKIYATFLVLSFLFVLIESLLNANYCCNSSRPSFLVTMEDISTKLLIAILISLVVIVAIISMLALYYIWVLK